jgi:hypothetical protein
VCQKGEFLANARLRACFHDDFSNRFPAIHAPILRMGVENCFEIGIKGWVWAGFDWFLL